MKYTVEKYLLLFCLLFSSLSIVAQDVVRDVPSRKKVGLVLSGGGAKGVAHIGTLKVLEEAGIPIDYIACTSMGAIVGGLYSVGYSPAILDSIMSSQNWQELLTDKISRTRMLFTEKELADKTILTIPFTKERVEIPTGLLSGGAVLDMLSLFTTGYHNTTSFDSLPIPFACIGYDIVSGEEVVMRSGNLATAIRASMSIPGAFSTVERDNHILIDGGVINNYPVDVVREMGADIVIGVDVSLITDSHEKVDNKVEERDINYGSLPFIIQTLMDHMGIEKLQKNKEATDLYLHPDVEPYTTASFTSEAIDSLILRGERVAREHWDEIIALKEIIGIPSDPVENTDSLYRLGGSGYPISDSIAIGKIFFEGIGLLDERNLKQMFHFKENDLVTHEEIHAGIARLKGTGFFSTVSYQLDNYYNKYDLIVTCKERARSDASLGVRFDTRDIAAGYLHTSIAPKELYGAVVEAQARLSSNPYANVGLYYQNAWFGRFGFSYQLKSSNYEILSGIDTVTYNVKFLTNRINIDLANFYYRNFNIFFSLRYENYHPMASSFYRNDVLFRYTKKENLFIYRLGVNYDSFDNASLPHNGVLFHAEYSIFTDNFSSYKDHPPFTIFEASVKGVIPLSNQVSLLPGSFARFVSSDDAPLSYSNFLGGYFGANYMDQQIPFYGLHSVSIVDEKLIGITLEARWNIVNNHYLWLKLNAATMGHTSVEILDPTANTTLFGGAVGYSLDTPVGPIEVMLDYCGFKGNKPGFYVSLGKYF